MGQYTYIVLLLAWALPVMLGQYLFGRHYLHANWRIWLLAIVLPTMYLSLADALAIGQGIWTLNDERILGIKLFGRLPVEEVLFFFCTNVMVTQSVLLLRWEGKTARARELLPVRWRRRLRRLDGGA